MSKTLDAMLSACASFCGFIDVEEFKNRITNDAFSIPRSLHDFELFRLLQTMEEHELNPFSGHIYMSETDSDAIVPVITFAGWNHIVSRHDDYQGYEFKYSEELIKGPDLPEHCPAWIECRIHRKDWSVPGVGRVHFKEWVTSANSWKNMPVHVLEQKAFAKAARYSFGYGSVLDSEEAKRLADMLTQAQSSLRNPEVQKNDVPQDAFDKDYEHEIEVQSSKLPEPSVSVSLKSKPSLKQPDLLSQPNKASSSEIPPILHPPVSDSVVSASTDVVDVLSEEQMEDIRVRVFRLHANCMNLGSTDLGFGFIKEQYTGSEAAFAAEELKRLSAQ